MNIDNSSTTVVIDAKSQAAIDAVRDRITLLDSENARLTKLKSVLDDSVRKIEADLAYKTTLLKEIDGKIEVSTVTLNDAIASEVEVRNAVEELQKTEEQIKRDLDEQATAIIEREKVVRAQEADMKVRMDIFLDREVQLDADTIEMGIKKNAISTLLKQL